MSSTHLPRKTIYTLFRLQNTMKDRRVYRIESCATDNLPVPATSEFPHGFPIVPRQHEPLEKAHCIHLAQPVLAHKQSESYLLHQWKWEIPTCRPIEHILQYKGWTQEASPPVPPQGAHVWNLTLPALARESGHCMAPFHSLRLAIISFL